MGIFDYFRRKDPEETRAAASGFTAEIIAARESYISGRRGIGELSATAQACISLWEQGFALADVEGTDLLDRRSMALAGRSLGLRGEAVFLIRDRLIPASDWEVRTRNGFPTAYRLSISEAGGGRTETALAAEVLHFRTGVDVATPYYGQAPLKRASLTAELLQAVEAALRDVFETAPLGSQVVHLPEGLAEDMANLRTQFRGKRGSTMVVEGVAQATAAGMHPNLGKAPDDLSPDISKSMTKETLDAARNAVSQAFGVLPALHSPATTGPLVREAQRHLAQWSLQPMAACMAEETSQKLATPVKIDTLRPLQAFDAGGRARAFAGIVQAMAQAQEAGVDTDAALKLVDWSET